jgi:hypothetical protein
MKVFCFLGHVSGKALREEEALISLWKKSWASYGWDPVVLTPGSLCRDAHTKKRLRKYARLPSRNKAKLDMWCYARWLAVAQQGGGFMSDYDVMNHGFLPRPFGKLICHGGTVPCLVSGSADEFYRAVHWFDELEEHSSWRFWEKRPHVSDMLVVVQKTQELISLRDCINYGEEGWKSARTVHYSNFVMNPKGYKPRHEWIPRICALPLESTASGFETKS